LYISSVERKLGSQEEIFQAYNILDSLYKVATNSEVSAPVSMLSAVREFDNGNKFRISKYDRVLHVRVTEKSGEEIHLGINVDGLSYIEFVDKNSKRNAVTVEDVEKKDDSDHVNRFKGFVIDITPWIVGRYLSEESKPFPGWKIIKKFIA
jgi:hypothetical protein